MNFGVIGLEAITYLHPEETAKITYQLGGERDRQFPSVKYQVISREWCDHNGKKFMCVIMPSSHSNENQVFLFLEID